MGKGKMKQRCSIFDVSDTVSVCLLALHLLDSTACWHGGLVWQSYTFVFHIFLYNMYYSNHIYPINIHSAWY